MTESFVKSFQETTESEPVDLTIDNSGKELDNVVLRQKGKPKKFENLSEGDIEEKRKVANVQERKRMKKLSKALEELRKCIPAQYHISNRKMSKIRTLRLAVNYIASLTEIIERDNILKQQAYQLESQMLQSTYSYFMPSPVTVHQFMQQSQSTDFQQIAISPYHTPNVQSRLDDRMTRRHLNFSPYCGTISPSVTPKVPRVPYNSRVKMESTPFRTPEMISRRRTSTITSPFINDMRNLNELSTSFVSPRIEESDKNVSEQSNFHSAKQYVYTLDGVSPIEDEPNFQGGTDCVFEPRRVRTTTSTQDL